MTYILTEDCAAGCNDDVLNDESSSGGVETGRPIDPPAKDGAEDDDGGARRKPVDSDQPEQLQIGLKGQNLGITMHPDMIQGDTKTVKSQEITIAICMLFASTSICNT